MPQGFLTPERERGIVQRGLALENQRLRLGNLGRPGACFVFLQRGSFYGDIRFCQTDVIIEGPAVQSGHNVSCRDGVAFLETHLRDPAADPKAKIDLADVDIAIEDERVRRPADRPEPVEPGCGPCNYPN